MPLMAYMFKNMEQHYTEWMVMNLQFKVVFQREFICRKSAYLQLAHACINNFESL